MSEQKFPPRVWIEIKQRQFTTNTKGSVPIASFSSGKNRVEYLSLTEHQHILAEKEKRIERMREALEYYSTADNIEVIKSQYFEQHDEGCREFGYVARLVLQEDGK